MRAGPLYSTSHLMSKVPKPKPTSRPDGRSAGRIWARTVLKGRDFWAGLAIGAGVAALSLLSGELDGGSQYYWPLVALMFGTSVGVWAVERWLADKLQKSSYGELVGIVDPASQAAFAPYLVVVIVGFLAGCFAIVAALSVDGIETGWVLATVQGALAWLVSWTLLGLLGVIRISHRHMRRDSEMENLRREYEARRRRPPEA